LNQKREKKGEDNLATLFLREFLFSLFPHLFFFPWFLRIFFLFHHQDLASVVALGVRSREEEKEQAFYLLFYFHAYKKKQKRKLFQGIL
jgi:hypothetical protein